MIRVITKTQINRLGERLRGGELTADDIKLLDLYRRGFRTEYETIIHVLRDELTLVATGRPAKSTNSIVEKLQREKSRLATIQDIAGCRIVVPDCIEQERVLAALSLKFPSARTIDRRIKPSNGYRAVHFVVEINEKPIEIQIRTILQHMWAELSERLADIDRHIKYGGGPDNIREILDDMSDRIREYEELELWNAPEPSTDEERAQLQHLLQKTQDIKESLKSNLADFIAVLDREDEEDSLEGAK